MSCSVIVRVAAALFAVSAVGVSAPAAAEPDPPAPDPAVVTPVATPVADAAPAVPDGAVASSPPQSATSPDGWTLTISAKDETQMPVAPLTTAISTREFAVGGVYNGALAGDGGTPGGVFEVGYQIGCGIDMSTSNGVSLTGTAGINPSITYFGFDFGNTLPDGIAPSLAGSLGGGITVGLKPGIVNSVPVTKKQYKGSKPWVSISNFRIKIDGCVGEAFVRSYAILTKSTDQGDALVSWYGVTKSV